MFLVRPLYYSLKPLLPEPFRMFLRRQWASRRRKRYGASWPINSTAGGAPEQWPGWPEGKRFALVLTHDVESERGADRCRKLAEMEQAAGFRSSFNFIPEGGYETPAELRTWLQANGFEVGVHDLRHDGKLYWSKKGFRAHSQSINRYMKEWQAVGFRSGFMLRNLEWLGEVDMLYDSSTFDTDPFEPQPEGAHTIFPFWVARNGCHQFSTCKSLSRDGYIELPYTLAQDSTLFLLLRERTIDIWKRKLDWLAERGGMALMNVHPDYICFDQNAGESSSYPVRFYQEFLDYVKERYGGQYWHALPQDVAKYAQGHYQRAGNQRVDVPASAVKARVTRPIWIDLDNTPHVPFFEPIIRELSRRGYRVVVTARDAFQVCDLADQKKIPYLKIGRHHGRNPIMKIVGLLVRALQLSPVVFKQRPALAVSHGSRAQLIASNLLRIPSVLLADYEHARHLPGMTPRWEMVPDVIPNAGLYSPPHRIRKYPGIKEDVYVSEVQPDPALLSELGLDRDCIIVTARPPATEAHYHNPESERLFFKFMERATAQDDVRIVLLPRNQRQADALKAAAPHWFAEGRVVIPRRAVNGLNLLWQSDLVVSGGGTMNREAAALGIPVYSIFRGPTGAVDRALKEQGKLVLVESVQDVDTKILLVHRKRKPLADLAAIGTLKSVVDQIESILELELQK